MARNREFSNISFLLISFVSLVVLCATALADNDTNRNHQTEDPALERLLVSVREGLKDFSFLEAGFTHEIIHRNGERVELARGKLLVGRDGRFRMEFESPKGRVIICDGKKISSWNPDINFVVETPYDRKIIASIFDFILGNRASELYELKLLNDYSEKSEGKISVLEIKPKNADIPVKKIVLALDQKFPFVHRILLVDETGTITRLTLSDFENKADISPKTFQFGIPLGAKVVKP